MVTHDQDEAMAMADRLVVMKDGKVQQTGTQEDLYERPATPFVAGFIGRSNMLEGRLGASGSVMEAEGAALRLAGRYAGSGACTLALRPERLSIREGGEGGAGEARGVVELANYLGPVREHLVRLGTGARVLVRDPTSQPGRLHAAGTAVTLGWDHAAERLFDAKGAPLPSQIPETAETRWNANA